MNHELPAPATEFTGFPPSGHMNCPMCDYSLNGLPAEHNCPECGLDYDAHTRVWVREFSERRRVAIIAGIAINCIYPIAAWTYMVLTGLSRNPWLLLGSLVNVGMAIWLINGYRKWPKRPPLVALVSTGIIYQFSNVAPRRIDWNNIVRTKARRVIYGATASLKLNRAPRRTNVGWFNTFQQAQSFVDLVEAKRMAKRLEASESKPT